MNFSVLEKTAEKTVEFSALEKTAEKTVEFFETETVEFAEKKRRKKGLHETAEGGRIKGSLAGGAKGSKDHETAEGGWIKGSLAGGAKGS